MFADTAEETADSPLVSCPGESCTTRSFFPFPRQAGNARAMRAIHPPQRQRRCCGGRVVKRSRRPEEIGGSLTDIGDKMTDFLVTACLVKHLDLLISVDTAPAHLAGALHWPSPCGRCCRLCPTGAGCANARTRRGTRQCAFSEKIPRRLARRIHGCGACAGRACLRTLGRIRRYFVILRRLTICNRRKIRVPRRPWRCCGRWRGHGGTAMRHFRKDITLETRNRRLSRYNRGCWEILSLPGGTRGPPR